MSVDLPEPDAPTMATNSPLSMRSETSSKARSGSPFGRAYDPRDSLSSIIPKSPPSSLSP